MYWLKMKFFKAWIFFGLKFDFFGYDSVRTTRMYKSIYNNCIERNLF